VVGIVAGVVDGGAHPDGFAEQTAIAHEAEEEPSECGQDDSHGAEGRPRGRHDGDYRWFRGVGGWSLGAVVGR